MKDFLYNLAGGILVGLVMGAPVLLSAFGFIKG